MRSPHIHPSVWGGRSHLIERRVSLSMSAQSPLFHASPSLRHRFVRLNPRFDRDETLGLLKVRSNSSTILRSQMLPMYSIQLSAPTFKMITVRNTSDSSTHQRISSSGNMAEFQRISTGILRHTGRVLPKSLHLVSIWTNLRDGRHKWGCCGCVAV